LARHLPTNLHLYLIMGQDTHNITGVSAPIKFTYDNWSVIYRAMTNSVMDNGQIYIIMLTKPGTGNDECYDVMDELIEYFNKYRPSSQAEFESYANEITTELHSVNLLPDDCTLLGQELHVFAKILDCHSRNISRRDRPYLFNQEMCYTPAEYITLVQEKTRVLTSFDIPETAITINTYVWDD
jgi:hypothetical protein